MKLRFGVRLFVVAVACVTSSGCTGVDDNDIQTLRDTLRRYIQSVNAADPALGAEVWAQTPEVIAVTPLGRFEGWQRVHTICTSIFFRRALSSAI